MSGLRGRATGCFQALAAHWRVYAARLSLSICIATPTQGVAQSIEPLLAAGVVLPQGGLGTQSRAGPVLRGGLTFGSAQRPSVRLRLEVEGTWLSGRSDQSARFQAVSALASLVLGPSAASRVTPYAVLGIGAERLSRTGVRNPYGTTLALRVGAGLSGIVAGQRVFLEVGPHVALTDFGIGRDYGLGVRVPIMAGVHF